MSYDEWMNIALSESPVEIIDGDRGKNYPNGDALLGFGYCLFLSAKNVTENGFVFDQTIFITREKDATLRNGKLKRHDIVLTTRGTVGHVAYYGDVVLYNSIRVNSGMVILRADPDQLCPPFLYWVLRSPFVQDQIRQLRTGSAQPQLPISILNRVSIPFPPLPEQSTIAATLSCLDEKIELNNRINKTLEEMAQAIFKSWFVDFEPFRDGEFVDSELGRIPKGWRVGTLSDIANITMGQSPIGTSYNEDDIGTPFFQGRAEFGWRYPQQRLSTTEPKRMAMKGDILLSVRAPVGDVNIAKVDCCIGRGLAAIRSIECTSSFLLYTINSLKPAFAVHNGEGTVFGSINKDALNSLRVLIPSNEVVEKFEMTVTSLDDMIHQLSLENDAFTALRDSLLPKLMNGEIRVPTNP